MSPPEPAAGLEQKPRILGSHKPFLLNIEPVPAL